MSHTHEIRALTPATLWFAMYRQADGSSEAVPVAAWASVEVADWISRDEAERHDEIHGFIAVVESGLECAEVSDNFEGYHHYDSRTVVEEVIGDWKMARAAS